MLCSPFHIDGSTPFFVYIFKLHLVIKHTGCPNPNMGSTNTTLAHNIKTI
ncbi:hypothetical protein [Plasmodium yoelii yoelii]|uniref:Uncharacterized protein n=1 Tax=Plasmodium yoelii yoelii TaxID=73239 RepID=Q7RG38_PLAYO|nr:hypothetical protein [Plasmodium yoelii yoelii]